jgi:DNA polymerase elongation subunit (family B)
MYTSAVIHRCDPDILVGHNFIGVDLDILLHRMKANRIDLWSKLGRLRRTKWPKLQAGAGGTGDSTFQERQVTAGRIVCDTFMSSKVCLSCAYFVVILTFCDVGIYHESQKLHLDKHGNDSTSDCT